MWDRSVAAGAMHVDSIITAAPCILLCTECAFHRADWSMNVVELCKKYRDRGVVAIDLAGDESLNCAAYPGHRMAYEVRRPALSHVMSCSNTDNTDAICPLVCLLPIISSPGGPRALMYDWCDFSWS